MSLWTFCHDDVRLAKATRSSAAADASGRPTMTDTNASGCGAESVIHGKTYTVLPDWPAPTGHFSLRCRQQDCECIAAGDSVEQAAPHCKDPSRSPDPSTLRRWAHRRLLSVCCWVKAGAIGERLLRAPTIVAWDLNALCRILPFEASSP